MFAKRGLAGVGDFHPFRIRRGIGNGTVVPVPPFVGALLRITLSRFFPDLLSSQRSLLVIAPDRVHRLVAAAVDQIVAEHPGPVAEKGVVSVPLIDAEI